MKNLSGITKPTSLLDEAPLVFSVPRNKPMQ